MNPQEFQLLLYCARSRPDAASVRDLVSKGIDWQMLLKLAAQNCVRPMLLQTLKSVCWDAVPQKIQLELTRFNKAMLKKICSILANFCGCSACLSKTPFALRRSRGRFSRIQCTVTYHLENSPIWTSSSDEADLSKAEDILTACGYQADFRLIETIDLHF